MTFSCFFRKKTRHHMGVINISSQAQMNTWTSQTLSRSSSKVKTAPKLDMTRIGRTFAGLNPVKGVKGRLSKFRVPTMNSVFYTKTAELEEMSDEVDDEAFVRDGNEVILSPPAHGVGNTSPRFFSELMRKQSVDQMDANLEELVNTDPDQIDLGNDTTNGDVVLTSCGILITDSEQVLRCLLKDRRAKSFGELASYTRGPLPDIEEGVLSPVDGSRRLSRSRDRMATHRRTSRSLDIDDNCFEERYGKVNMRDAKKRLMVKGTLALTEEEFSSEENQTQSPEVTAEQDSSEDTLLVVLESSPDAKDGALDPIPSKEDIADSSKGKDGEVAGERKSDETTPIVTIKTELASPTESTTPVLLPPGKEHESDAWVNLNVDYADQSGALSFHPTIKMSLSDGAISYSGEIEDLTVSAAVFDGAEEAPGSALSKLKNRMSNITLPDAMAAPGTSLRRSHAVAMQNKIYCRLSK